MSNHAPTGLLFVLAITFVFQAAILGEDFNEIDFSIDNPRNQSEEGGFLESFTPDSLETLAAIVGVIWGFVQTFFNFLTFNVPGAPTWVRFIVGMVINGSLAWAIAALIRGGD